eukprot:TRINITY_DN11426_c0_g1_i4.p1 TRINITY_DN11426_c0_g1~~TRINITY_DN11426_c0_g1_i4.p1  ORF type:complete len:636 (-),score=130.26 TRINITY_DN11426_c0_g1_i4:340-2247(-)
MVPSPSPRLSSYVASEQAMQGPSHSVRPCSRTPQHESHKTPSSPWLRWLRPRGSPTQSCHATSGRTRHPSNSEGGDIDAASSRCGGGHGDCGSESDVGDSVAAGGACLGWERVAMADDLGSVASHLESANPERAPGSRDGRVSVVSRLALVPPLPLTPMPRRTPSCNDAEIDAVEERVLGLLAGLHQQVVSELEGFDKAAEFRASQVQLRLGAAEKAAEEQRRLFDERVEAAFERVREVEERVDGHAAATCAFVESLKAMGGSITSVKRSIDLAIADRVSSNSAHGGGSFGSTQASLTEGFDEQSAALPRPLRFWTHGVMSSPTSSTEHECGAVSAVAAVQDRLDDLEKQLGLSMLRIGVVEENERKAALAITAVRNSVDGLDRGLDQSMLRIGELKEHGRGADVAVAALRDSLADFDNQFRQSVLRIGDLEAGATAAHVCERLDAVDVRLDQSELRIADAEVNVMATTVRDRLDDLDARLGQSMSRIADLEACVDRSAVVDAGGDGEENACRCHPPNRSHGSGAQREAHYLGNPFAEAPCGGDLVGIPALRWTDEVLEYVGCLVARQHKELATVAAIAKSAGHAFEPSWHPSCKTSQLPVSARSALENLSAALNGFDSVLLSGGEDISPMPPEI